MKDIINNGKVRSTKTRMKSSCLTVLLLLVGMTMYSVSVSAQILAKDVTEHKAPNSFVIGENGKTTPLILSDNELTGVVRIAGYLQNDIQMLGLKRPELVQGKIPSTKQIILIGTIGESSLLDELIKNKKIDLSAIHGKWEASLTQTIENPFPGVEQALVIAGSDKRGTIYGIFDLSRAMGISPWYWWADVPVVKHSALYINPGKYSSDSPMVKYRGIFINDEAPALRNWSKEKFGGFNHKFYEHVFELILRLKGNYLWPAMWLPTVFFTDDPENSRLADEYGIVISTSHHEAMMRSHEEWARFNGGEWNYKKNKEKLQEFWQEGIERMGNYESMVTLGMRGDGDEAMSEETAVGLLQNIIADQRNIISDVTGKPAVETPQVWAIYKEVQDYYDRGMRVDDDITVLFCDDNWGNIRILPKKEDIKKKGKFGIYYHFDYVGGPVSYRWQNVTQIERVWEQMNLAYKSGVKDLWLVNVGDIKPMELPISFFLDLAWNPEAFNAGDLPNYYETWVKQQFGGEYASEIAKILSLYTKYNARRTPEMLEPGTYNLENYREADWVIEEYIQLRDRSQIIYSKLPNSYKSAFYQLVLSPIEMCCNLNEMYVAAAKNKFYAEQGRASANYYAQKVKELFIKDAELTLEFHEDLENGKWNHMMSQTHIGYTSWNHSPANKMPAVSFVHTADSAVLGYMLEYGNEAPWGGFSVEGDGLYSNTFSSFDPINDQRFYVEIFNRGNKVLNYTISAEDEWIKLSKEKGSVQFDEKVDVSIDWSKAPKGRKTGKILITGAGKKYLVNVPVRNDLPTNLFGFVENNGVVSIEAAHFTNKYDGKDINWIVIPNLGRTGSSVSVEPANANRQVLEDKTPRLEYKFTVFDESKLIVETYLSPSLNYKKNEGLKYAIAIDDEEPQIINMHEGESEPDWEYPEWWNKSVANHIKKKVSIHKLVKAGKHTLKVWMIDPGVVFQKFVIDMGGVKPSYLGPPESIYIKKH